MNTVKFKTLDAESVHRKLTAVGDRLLCVEQIIDKVLNNTDSCHLLPVLQDAQSELGEVFFDMTEWKDSKLAIMVINSILAPAHLLCRWAVWKVGVNPYGLGC